MTNEEYMLLERPDTLVTAAELENKQDRTLLFGYNLDRSTWHVYLKDGEIITVKYEGWKQEPVLERIEVTENRLYLPSKRLYPACCDFEFCSLLKMAGCNLVFTFYESDCDKIQFYGEVL